MKTLRTVKKVTSGKHAVDGAGVKLVRVIGYHDTDDYDPFLMLDAFDSTNPADYTKGFPWHPHRGIETITYLIQGDIEHRDSLGNKGSIRDGDCQWMTAGSGIIHQEMPQPSERMLGAQLWLNLPTKDKMTAPKYGDIKKEDVAVVNESTATIRVIAWNYLETKGAFEGSYVKAVYLDVEVKPGGEWEYDSDEHSTLFIYIVQGEGRFEPDKDTISEKQAVLFNSGQRFWVQAGESGIRFLLLCAKPLHESIAWGGPIVMNTQAELDLAFKELNENKFIKSHQL